MPEEFAASCLRADGSAAGCLRQVPAAPGMTVLIPAGTPHALGAGILLYEIQQPSNVTFRLDDWGRVDAFGMARALHHREGLALVDPRSRPEPIPRVPLADAAADRALLVATRVFRLGTDRLRRGCRRSDRGGRQSPGAHTRRRRGDGRRVRLGLIRGHRRNGHPSRWPGGQTLRTPRQRRAARLGPRPGARGDCPGSRRGRHRRRDPRPRGPVRQARPMAPGASHASRLQRSGANSC